MSAEAVVTTLKSMKLHGMASAVAELSEQGAPAFKQSGELFDKLIKAEVAEHEVRSINYQPLTRRMVQGLPAAFRRKAEPSSHEIAIDGDGVVLMNLQDRSARFAALTGVLETRDSLYLTSLFGHHLGWMKKRDL